MVDVGICIGVGTALIGAIKKVDDIFDLGIFNIDHISN